MDRRGFLWTLPSSAYAFGVHQRVPSFSGRTMNGEKFDSASLKGKPVLIQFWTTWCGYCRREQPALETIYKQYAPGKLTMLAINVNESREKVQEFLAKSPRSPKVVLTEDTDLVRLVDPKGFPVYILLGKDGLLEHRQDGAGGTLALRQMLLEVGLGDG
ncbi:MAG: TlpA disulfide reductase family protein [Acidobacteria bacterium]|nr:TlpA disulfide reductase family protein [Acidobacteriota bacterium]